MELVERSRKKFEKFKKTIKNPKNDKNVKKINEKVQARKLEKNCKTYFIIFYYF